MPRYYLGVDGGQSSTVALICDENGRILGEGVGGPCNHVGSAEGRAKFISAVGSCLHQAGMQASFDPRHQTFASVCLGFSGGSADKETHTRELIRSEKYKITHDAEIALIGATAGDPGIVVIGGTGSISFGRNSALETARAGGWGYVFGDEGGAFDLARQALRAALRFEEGWGPPTSVYEALLEVSGQKTANELLHHLYNNFDRTQIATFAPLVTAAAETGDQVALEILRTAATALTRIVRGVYMQLFKQAEVVPILPIGGVFQSPALCSNLTKALKESVGCPTHLPRFKPAAGALLEALRLDENHSQLSGMRLEE